MKNADSLTRELLATIITHTDAKRFLEGLDEAIANSFTTKETVEELFSRLFTHEQKEVLVEIVSSAGVTIQDGSKLHKLLEGIRTVITKIPVMEITVAVEPTERALTHIKEWLDTHSSTKVFLEVKVNPRIIGGLRIAFNGKYHDYTVKKTIIEKL